MKLLLDSMYSPAIAEQLRRRGHDVIAARAESKLVDLPDPDLFAVAQGEGRVLVTENIRDFLDLDTLYREQDLPHPGLILTNHRSYPRTLQGAIGPLVTALDAWLQEHADDEPASSMIWWL